MLATEAERTRRVFYHDSCMLWQGLFDEAGLNAWYVAQKEAGRVSIAIWRRRQVKTLPVVRSIYGTKQSILTVVSAPLWQRYTPDQSTAYSADPFCNISWLSYLSKRL